MNRASRILSAIGFLFLSFFCGIGVAWLLAAVLYVRTIDDLTHIMPFLIAGGLAGFIAGGCAVWRTARSDLKTKAKIDERYVGDGGRFRIYLGAPLSIFAFFLMFLFEPLLNKLGTVAGAWTAWGIFVVIAALGFAAYDRVPKRWLVPLGVIGWLLTVASLVGQAVYRLHR